MYLAERETTTTLADRLDDVEVAVLPTGSVEQHGPALPLGTDFMAAEAVARSLDRDDALVLPTVPVGVSEHHRQFHGTLWTEPETFEDYVSDVVASVASHGVRKAVLVNGHGGNSTSLRRAARRLRQDEVAFAAPWNWWSNLDGLESELFDVEGITHADAMETSMVYHVAEELVREDALEEAEAGASDGFGTSVHGAGVGFDTADFSESGVAGEPTNASVEAGERLFEKASSELDALVAWLTEQPFSDLLPKPHR
ncbi:MAG: creatininase family protein [Haloferacaceae archaeon]